MKTGLFTILLTATLLMTSAWAEPTYLRCLTCSTDAPTDITKHQFSRVNNLYTTPSSNTFRRPGRLNPQNPFRRPGRPDYNNRFLTPYIMRFPLAYPGWGYMGVIPTNPYRPLLDWELRSLRGYSAVCGNLCW